MNQKRKAMGNAVLGLLTAKQSDRNKAISRFLDALEDYAAPGSHNDEKVTIQLSRRHAETLKDLLQNPLSDDESADVGKFRATVFHTLKAALK